VTYSGRYEFIPLNIHCTQNCDKWFNTVFKKVCTLHNKIETVL